MMTKELEGCVYVSILDANAPAPPSAAGAANGGSGANGGGGGGSELEALLARLGLSKLLPKLLENDIDSIAELRLCTADDYKVLDISIGSLTLDPDPDPWP